jgi:hypothetical protein
MMHRSVGAFILAVLFAIPVMAAQTNFQGYGFKAYVVKDHGRHYREFRENNKSMLKVKADEEYSIVVYNPLPVRAAVAVSIDGLNTIDGKRTSPRLAKKWMINPHSSITIAGWQTSSKTMRKFVFTKDSESYAQWRENKNGKAFTKNLGVIGVAWFWNHRELEEALHPPQPFVKESGAVREHRMSKRSRSLAPAMPSSAAKAEARAGTGMGKVEHHRVTEVKFKADRGMFALHDVLKIYYEFAEEPEEPQPFVEENKDAGRFAPDMHN